MTKEEYDKAPLLDKILYDETGMLAANHPAIATAMEKYLQAKLTLLGLAAVSKSLPTKTITTKCSICKSFEEHYLTCTECGNVC